VWSQKTAQRAIIIGGCLGMAWTQLTMSPATVDYARALGADGFHYGLLGALPVVTLLAQFIAALVVNHLHYRRPLWFWLSILHRLLLVPAALGPWLFPETSSLVWLWVLIAATALNHTLLQFCSPLWLSWMSDILPHEGLSRYWGVRHLWQQWVAAAALVGTAFVFLKSGLTIIPAFAVLMVVAAVLGVADLFFFWGVEEPPVQRHPQPKLLTVLAGPFLDKKFRTFITFNCFWHFAAMFGAPFISVFLLEYVGMSLFNVLILWAISWVGGAVLSGWLGTVTEKFGNRPTLILCTVCKSTLMVALILTPPSPTAAFWILAPIFMLDALLNAGFAIATNGYLLKQSPRTNRTMFIAAGMAVAGLVGGVSAVLAGLMLKYVGNLVVPFAGLALGGYQLVFAVSLALRLASIEFARRIAEPESHSTRQVLTLLVGATPLRIMRFPVGLYRDDSSPSLPKIAPQISSAQSAPTSAPVPLTLSHLQQPPSPTKTNTAA
jgi:MFS family permease